MRFTCIEPYDTRLVHELRKPAAAGAGLVNVAYPACSAKLSGPRIVPSYGGRRSVAAAAAATSAAVRNSLLGTVGISTGRRV